jgi:class 3 adenylate cyclase
MAIDRRRFSTRSGIGKSATAETLTNGAPSAACPRSSSGRSPTALRTNFTDRVLTTVLYTDIVDSTVRASTLGDTEWKQLLDRHDRLVGRETDRHQGILVRSTGDGALARFDGPARAVSCGLAIACTAPELGLQV